MKVLRNGIELIAVRLLTTLFASLTERSALIVGRNLGLGAYYLLRRRRRIALQNLSLCRVGDDDSARRAIVRDMCRHYGMTIAEFCRLKIYSRLALIDKVEMADFAALRAIYEQGRGVLLLSGHYGNWELLVQSLAVRGLKIDMVVRRQHNLQVDAFVNRLRQSENINVVSAEGSPRSLIKALKEGRAAAVLMDVWGGKDGIPARLFGYEVATLSGAIEIALKYSVPIVIAFVMRLKTGRHRLGRLYILASNEGEQVKTVDQVIAVYHHILEEAVRRNPSHWLWTHKRFKNVINY